MQVKKTQANPAPSISRFFGPKRRSAKYGVLSLMPLPVTDVFSRGFTRIERGFYVIIIQQSSRGNTWLNSWGDRILNLQFSIEINFLSPLQQCHRRWDYNLPVTDFLTADLHGLKRIVFWSDDGWINTSCKDDMLVAHHRYRLGGV